MGQIQVHVTDDILAPPDVIYALLADYKHGHPHILPKNTFTNLQVEAGGIGAGTIISLSTRLGTITRQMRMAVSEPEPGTVLQETDLETQLVTTFTVQPKDRGDHARVTIATTWDSAPGLWGVLERLLAPGLLRRVYQRELSLLADYINHLPARE